jgi:hypothetical protein
MYDTIALYQNNGDELGPSKDMYCTFKLASVKIILPTLRNPLNPHNLQTISTCLTTRIFVASTLGKAYQLRYVNFSTLFGCNSNRAVSVLFSLLYYSSVSRSNSQSEIHGTTEFKRISSS